MPELSIPFEWFEFVLFVIAAGAGVFGSLLGLGGGAIIVPLLTLGFGIPIRYAIGASIVAVIATSSSAAATYVKKHIANIRVAMLLESATTVGALGGVMLSSYVSEKFLYLLFAIILFYSTWMMSRKKDHAHLPENSHEAPAPTQAPMPAPMPVQTPVQTPVKTLADRLNLHSSYEDPALHQVVPYTVHHVPLGYGLMLGAGVISGLLGIGSGSLKVPAMDIAMKLPLKVSSATSNFMMGVTAAASAGAYYMKGDVLPVLAAPVALGTLVGAWIGTRLMMNLSAQKIRGLFIFVLLMIALQMFYKGVRG